MAHSNSLLLVLRVALTGTFIALALGLWIAQLLQRRNGREVIGKWLIGAGLALPPAIFCAYFLFRFTGRAFHWPWAVAAALVNSLPLLSWWVLTSLERLEPRYQNAARSLGASEWRVFWRIATPLTWRRILAGAAIVFARIFTEFAAVLLISRRLSS
jgi:molybdate transport system permease protein